MPLIDFDISTLDDSPFNLVVHTVLKKQDSFPAFNRWIVQVAHSRLDGFLPPLPVGDFNKRTLDNSAEHIRYWESQFYIMSGESSVAEESDNYVLLQDFCRAVLKVLIDEMDLRADRDTLRRRKAAGCEDVDAEWTADIDIEGTNWVEG